jgi:hypothetical protein
VRVFFLRVNEAFRQAFLTVQSSCPRSGLLRGAVHIVINANRLLGVYEDHYSIPGRSNVDWKLPRFAFS